MFKLVVATLPMLALCACGRGTPATTPPPAAPTAAAPAQGIATDEGTIAGTPAGFTNRIWLRAESGNVLGAMQVFLDDGTLLTDSCFETYRLSRWRAEGVQGLAWQEDGIVIRATIVSVTPDELVLNLMLRHGVEEQRFGATQVPYVCPDMPR